MKAAFRQARSPSLVCVGTEMAGQGPQRRCAGFATLAYRRHSLKEVRSGRKGGPSWQGPSGGPWPYVTIAWPGARFFLGVFGTGNGRKGPAKGGVPLFKGMDLSIPANSAKRLPSGPPMCKVQMPSYKNKFSHIFRAQCAAWIVWGRIGALQQLRFWIMAGYFSIYFTGDRYS